MLLNMRAVRVGGVVLSLISPGAGHVLLGAFRRGVLWAFGPAVLALAAMLVVPSPILALAISVGIVSLTILAAAVDAARVSANRPPWKVLVLALAGFLVATQAFRVFVAEPIGLRFRAHDAQAFTMPSASMMPTLQVGDYILTDKSIYRSRPPQRGDIVVFKYPGDDKRDFVKRIVALSGERVLIRGRQVLIDDAPMPEPYVMFADSRAQDGGEHCGYAYGCEPTPVPADAYFVMGDNRDNSQDSRYFGFINRDRILGRVSMIYWSWDGDRHWARFDRVGRRL